MKKILAAFLVTLFLTASRILADDIKVWPLFYQNTDPETQTSRTEFLWPLYVRETTSAYTVNQFLSFPQSYPGDYPSQFYFLWPFSGLRTGNGHDAWLFPLLWSGSEQGRNDHYFALFPAFYYGEDGNKTTLNLALLQHNYWDQDGAGHYLFPLFWNSWQSRAGYDSRAFGLLPLFWMNKSQNIDASYPSRSTSGGALLLSWWNRRSSTNSTGNGTSVSESASGNLFPVFRRARSSTMTVSGVSGDGERTWDSLWIIPYWQSHETSTNRHNTVSESRHRLFPLYWDWSETRDKKGESGRALLPLWWHSSTLEGAELTESADFLVPIGAHFYKKGEYDTRNILGPMFNRTENTRTGTVRYDAFFPFFSLTRGVSESGGHIFPLAGWHTERGRHDNLWYGFPLGWDCESQESFDYRMSRPQFFALHEMETRPVVSEPDCRKGPRRTVAFYPLLWSKRQADEQHHGVLPFYWRNCVRYGRTVSDNTVLPLLLGNYQTSTRDDQPVASSQNFLLSLISNGRGPDSRNWRVFPLFSYDRCGGSLDYSSFILPFAYDSWRDPDRPEQVFSSKLSIPFSFLPLFRSETSQEGGTTNGSRKSWFFPFYKRETLSGSAGDGSKLSILWPLWNGEWVNDETHIRGLGGVVNYYERDSGGFVDQRFLYRVFTRHTRSWFNQHELMPLFARSSREDGSSSWGFLGGLLGGGSDGSRNYLRLLYLKIPTRKVAPLTDEARAASRKRHAELALDYLRHDRHDRAAIEFMLAGDACADDAAFQLAAGEAYLKAKPDALGKELRSSLPKSLDPIYGRSNSGNLNTIERNLRSLAVQRFEEAIRLGADKPLTLVKLAGALSELGRHDEALKRLSESDRLRPSFVTAMMRLKTANTIWGESCSGATPDPVASRTALATVHAILDEMKARYPRSPSLVLREGELLLTESDPQRHRWHVDFRGEGYDGEMYYPEQDAFAQVTVKRLELYRQGAGWTPGAEEQAWLDTRPARPRSRGAWLFFVVSFGVQLPPDVQCARKAAAILNRQLATLISDKHYDRAESLREPISRILPKVCSKCPDPAAVKDRYANYQEPASQYLQHLYALYITATNRPLDYIAAVEELAPTLCKHQQPAVSNALESVRLEQQYIKTWHIAGEVAGKRVGRDYAGKFFERYVDLDAILGQPDNCTVTAECVVQSPDERKIILRLGFDRTLTAELNGRVVFGPKSRKIAVRDEYKVPLVLKAGTNRLKLTVTDDTLAYGFFARLSSESGEFMKDLVIDTAHQP
jgi:tetratricopeptide (TPR) repeat protein